MCYSATASFAASGVLAASSVAIARTPKDRESVPLSLIPAIFAAHQAIEGLLWLIHDGRLPNAYQPTIVRAYVLIAFVLWPIFVPWAVRRTESDRRRQLVILACQAAGLWAGLVTLAGILRVAPAVSADCCRLAYRVDTPDMAIVPYLAGVSIPFLVSSRRVLQLFGIGIITSCATATALTLVAFPSVWCFFAALLSTGLYLHFRAEAPIAGYAACANAAPGINDVPTPGSAA